MKNSLTEKRHKTGSRIPPQAAKKQRRNYEKKERGKISILSLQCIVTLANFISKVLSSSEGTEANRKHGYKLKLQLNEYLT